MKISLENALGPHVAALQVRSQRMEVLANNIANADTPNFKARDIDFQAALEQATGGSHSTIYRTNAKHLPGGSFTHSENTLVYSTPSAASVDGNTVETHAEQAKILQNNLQFQAALRFVNGRFQGMMEALRREQ